MNIQSKLCWAVVIVSACAVARLRAEPSFTVTDLGTLGGNTSSANSVAGNGTNAAGMIVGSSTTSDNSEHAFLFVEDKMYDLNELCDLSQTNFKVLTVARTISDSMVIIGDGITKNGDKHAFKMTPIEVAGGQWFYDCCQWIWKQAGGGWWWEEGCGCYKWHGPPGHHPPCPPQPPPCWNWPLPCCPECPPPPGRRPPPPGTPTPTPHRRQPQYPSPTPTLPPPVMRTPTPPTTYIPGVQQTPTPGTFIPGVQGSPTPQQPVGVPALVKQTPTPTGTGRFRGRGRRHATATPAAVGAAHGKASPTPSRRASRKAHPTPTPQTIR